MLQSKLLAFLRCPDDRSELTPADDELVRQINNAIQSGRLLNHAGGTVEQTIDAGLIRTRGHLLYPIVEGIPILLSDEAIPLDQLTPLNGS